MTALKTKFTNGAETTLSSSLPATDTTINVTSTSGFPAVPFYVVIDPDVDASREVILVDSSTTATTFALSASSQRGKDGTTATTHSLGAKVAFVPVAAHLTDLHDRVDATNTDVSGKVSKVGGDTITASGAAVIPLVVKGASGQTANLFEALDSTGAAKATLNANGGLILAGGLGVSGQITTSTTVDPHVFLQSNAAASRPLIIRGAASQTAALQQWQDSAGAVIAQIGPTGTLVGTLGGLFRVLEVGVVDSAGAGFRTVRVAN